MNNITPGRKEIHLEVTQMLGVHLANMYSLMTRLQNFHWNVEGPQFPGLHSLFEEHYQKLWKEVDEIAERIRAMGEYAPGSQKEFFELSQISDRATPIDADGMLDDLITCSVIVREHCEETLKVAELVPDEVTVDMMVHHLAFLEKAIWMYGSSLSRSEGDEVAEMAIPKTTKKNESPSRSSDANGNGSHMHIA